MEINKIYNEDNLETMAKMPNDFIDLIVTSPPYNIGINYDIMIFIKIKLSGMIILYGVKNG